MEGDCVNGELWQETPGLKLFGHGRLVKPGFDQGNKLEQITIGAAMEFLQSVHLRLRQDFPNGDLCPTLWRVVHISPQHQDCFLGAKNAALSARLASVIASVWFNAALDGAAVVADAGLLIVTGNIEGDFQD